MIDEISLIRTIIASWDEMYYSTIPLHIPLKEDSVQTVIKSLNITKMIIYKKCQHVFNTREECMKLIEKYSYNVNRPTNKFVESAYFVNTDDHIRLGALSLPIYFEMHNIKISKADLNVCVNYMVSKKVMQLTGIFWNSINHVPIPPIIIENRK